MQIVLNTFREFLNTLKIQANQTNQMVSKRDTECRRADKIDVRIEEQH